MPWLSLRSLMIAALVAVPRLLVPDHAIAAPQQLDCQLTDLEVQAGANSVQQSENRSISIVFDDEASTLAVAQNGMSQPMDHVTVSSNAVSGYGGEISVGVDPGSWNIVLQTYKPDSMQAEFGICHPTVAPASAKTSQ